MADIFLFSLRVVMPILLLIALGWGTARWGRWDRAFFDRLNALCFRLFLPLQLFVNVYEMESLRDVNWRVLLYLVVGILLALALGTVLRLLVSPAILISLAVLLQDALQLTAAEIPALVAVFASPAAVSGPVMVQEIGGDEQLANQLVMWTTVLSMLSVFLFAFTLKSCGLL